MALAVMEKSIVLVVVVVVGRGERRVGLGGVAVKLREITRSLQKKY